MAQNSILTMGTKRDVEVQAPAHAPRKKTKAASKMLATDLRTEFSSVSIDAAARAAIARERKRASPPQSANLDSILHGAEVIYLTEDKTSWIYHVPGWYKALYELSESCASVSYQDWFESLWKIHPEHHDSIKMFGKDVLMPRFQQVYGQSYKFSGKLFEAKPFPELLQHALSLMQELVVDPKSGEPYAKAGLVNWYANGEHYMGPHTDDESNIYTNSPVFSLSLGASRRFVFTTRANSISTSVAKRLEIMLQDGDLLIMGGTTQKTHKHALPKMKQCQAKRVSITLRCFKP